MTTQQPQDATNPGLPVRDTLSAAQRAAEALSALNWQTISCQCVHHRTACANNAAHIVHIHALHDCNRSDLDPFGNRVEIRCSDCLSRLRAVVGDQLRRVPGRACCEGCGAPIAEVRDVVRRVGRL